MIITVAFVLTSTFPGTATELLAEDVDDPDEVDDVPMNDDLGTLPYYHAIMDIVHLCLFVCLFH